MKTVICIIFVYSCIGSLLSQGTSLLNNPNFTLVWQEEFNGNSLNRNRWTVEGVNPPTGVWGL